MFQYSNASYPIYDSHPMSNFIISICYSLFSSLYSYRKDTQLVKRMIGTAPFATESFAKFVKKSYDNGERNYFNSLSCTTSSNKIFNHHESAMDI